MKLFKSLKTNKLTGINIKYILTLSLFISHGAIILAQQTEVRGQIKDAQTNEALEFANIALLSPTDSSLITGARADFEGNFSFPAPAGQYLLRVGFIGYDELHKEIEVRGRQTNLGSIRLYPGEKTLAEVTVTGIRAMFESDIDKRVFNVENNILAEGASASELLNTLPSIQVNEIGEITMRGSGNVLIYINGRPTNLTSEENENILAQFPASSISSVELITNPSARYDAQGVGGIINILLKKEERLGWNGQINASAGTRDKYQGGLSLNYGTNKWLFNSSYTYNYRKLFELSESLRRTSDPMVSPILDQDFNTRNTNQNHMVRLGVDHHLTSDITLGIYGRYSSSSRDRLRIYHQRHMDLNLMLDSLFVRVLTEDQSAYNVELGTTFDIRLDDNGHKLYGSFSYANSEQDRTEYFDQRYFLLENQEVPSKRQDQIYGRPIASGLYIAQMDYTRPLPDGSRFEFGAKGTFSSNSTGQTFDQLDLERMEYIQNDTIANRFDFDEGIVGGYGIYRRRFGELGLQFGLRAEQTWTNGFDQNSQNTYKRNYFDLFPSIFFTYGLGVEEELLMNYSRRINRPGWGQLAPFYNAQDLLNTRYGNPELRPEYTDSYEIGYSKGWERLLFSSTVYHRRTTDAMTRIFGFLNNNSVVQLWDNAGRRRNTGLEMINQMEFASNLDMTLTGNFYYSEVDVQNVRDNYVNSNFTWTVTLLANWVIPNVVNLQAMADYRGPIIQPQGLMDPIYGLDIGVRRNLFNNQATIGLSVSDVFKTRVYRIQTDDIEFSQMRMFNQESRIGMLSFTYRFGGFRAREEKPTIRYSDDPF
jgi:iron complex outermembrane recepter protein